MKKIAKLSIYADENDKPEFEVCAPIFDNENIQKIRKHLPTFRENNINDVIDYFVGKGKEFDIMHNILGIIQKFCDYSGGTFEGSVRIFISIWNYLVKTGNKEVTLREQGIEWVLIRQLIHELEWKEE